MKNISIRIKLHGVFVLTMIVVLVLGLYSSREMTKFQTEKNNFITEVNMVNSTSLSATIEFKDQVQEWKNILIRGHKEADFKKYSEQFENKRLLVIEKVKQLIELTAKFPSIQAKAKSFLVSHEELTQKYYVTIKKMNVNTDGLGYRDVDAEVRNVDRHPTVLLTSIQDDTAALTKETKISQDIKQDDFFKQIGIAAVVITLALILMYISLIEITILRPIKILSSIIKRSADGDHESRARSAARDEIGVLSSGFDNLLDDRDETLKKAEDEKNQLNSSIIDLLRSVSELSRKDLTVRVPVSENVTGSVSDAINLFSDETAKTLKKVSAVAIRVSESSHRVREQSVTVIGFANSEREETVKMLDELDNAVYLLKQVAEFSKVTNSASEKALETTDNALKAVTETVLAINSIRDVIREIEKRIKRLGERSQEITQAVGLINDIAERTHVLALNAGMQAAQAGEAGKGFIVVANEVQRLAESSREATNQITGLVKNIQVDTNDAIATMNIVTSQVVDGNRLAEKASEKMQETKETTSHLAGFVTKIAETTQEQVEVGASLKARAEIINETTLKTNAELESQLTLAEGLLHDAEELVNEVQVFKLPK